MYSRLGLPTWSGTTRSGQVQPESALDWQVCPRVWTYSSYLRYQGRYWCRVLKPGSSLDPVNLLLLCFGYCSPLVQWDCNRYNVTKVPELLKDATLVIINKIKQNKNYTYVWWLSYLTCRELRLVGMINRCCFYYFVRNCLVPLLEALCAQMYIWVFDFWSFCWNDKDGGAEGGVPLGRGSEDDGEAADQREQASAGNATAEWVVLSDAERIELQELKKLEKKQRNSPSNKN